MDLSRASSENTRAAFSFTELAVVIGMVVLLGLLAFPRLARAAGLGTTEACLNNLRQTGRAWGLYANDHSGRLVYNLGISETVATISQQKYLNWANNVMDWTINGLNTNLSYVAAGRLTPYLEGNLLAFKCPADTYLSSAQRAAGWARRVRSYSMNAFMGASSLASNLGTSQGRNEYYPAWRQFLLLSAVPNPSRTFVFVEEHPDSINDGIYLNDPSSARMWADLPASFHNGSCGAGFADGSAEMHRWLYPRTTIPVRYVYTSTVIPAAESADYLWLAQRTSVDPTTLGASKIAASRAQIVWSSISTNYVLQRTESLAGGAWTNTGTAPVKDLGQHSVAVELEGPQGFFRLKRQ